MVTLPKLHLTALILLLTASLPATMTERLSLEQMVERSERIVAGRCVRAWPAWDANRTAIWTHYEVQVSDPLKGGAASTITVSEPGGTVDGVTMLIEGMPQYQVGDEVVVFLYRTPIGFWRTRGLGQGKFRVADGKVRGEGSGVVLVDPAGPPVGEKLTDLRRIDGMRLEDFKAQVRNLAAGRTKGNQ